ncbi:PP2C family protein-serine/threonine phosphatase [Actinomadura rudentiformis]|uniref:PPM-type phosphatase domain-containing protein n=1 Tax=Actinomadura rudentiformis TaxID=359158 RepID=A0A6H9YMD4_9ACTN|nr:protein phosphatase 2C domain-containing protein [Actinomadura rudentiformis]KAB2346970.1 hypothetical protein F8566_22545 [Actinomadura rudentiformis]
MAFAFAVHTDPGINPIASDAVHAGTWLAAVAEGAGVTVGGELAAEIVVDALAGLDTPTPPDDLTAAMHGALDDARRRIAAVAERSPHHAEMSTMFTALVSADDRIGFIHLGAGRAYMLRGDLYQISPEPNAESRSPHQLPPPTRAGGLLNAAGDRLDSLTLTIREAESRDRYLLCSTALDASLDDQSKYRILSGHADPAIAARHLIDAAIRCHNQPPLTALIADIVEPAPRHNPIKFGQSRSETQATSAPSGSPVTE